MSAPRRVHYLGTEYASRAACGRLVLGRPNGPLRPLGYTAEVSATVGEVTCRACLAALART